MIDSQRVYNNDSYGIINVRKTIKTRVNSVETNLARILLTSKTLKEETLSDFASSNDTSFRHGYGFFSADLFYET